VFSKLVVTILVLGFTAALLLVDRQQRLDLAAEMSRTHQRMSEHERSLWRMRTDIAYRTRPAMIRAAAEQLDVEWEPLHDRLALAQERKRDESHRNHHRLEDERPIEDEDLTLERQQ